ncbi:FtsK/SpoIIIE domain-containing protein [Dactylosporangium sp. CS-033363]|uniref:FtsK/SpoIIIE domain-containing protein n=1 Tax=Dactylosporangium sp. CS-033363 TaxID=3239935 RepID=UPI003D93DBEC
MADGRADPRVDPVSPQVTARVQRHASLATVLRWRAGQALDAAVQLAVWLLGPVTLWRAFCAVLRGFGEMVASLWRYGRGDDLAHLRDQHPLVYEARRRGRRVKVWLSLIIICGLFILLQLKWPWLRWAVPAGLGVVLFGVGARERQILGDPPRVAATITTSEAGVLEAVATALKVRDVDDLELRTPVQRDGDGWVCRILLPAGLSAQQLIAPAARRALASALGVSYGQVWPAGVDANERLADLRVLDKPLYTGGPVRHPLGARPRAASAWAPIALGQDPHGRGVELVGRATAVFLGGLQQVGKSTAIAGFVLPHLLDVTAKVVVIDGKGPRGLNSQAYQHLCERVGYRADLQTIHSALQWVLDECERRMVRLGELGVDRVDEDLAAVHPDLGAVLLVIDELRLVYRDLPEAMRRDVERLLSGILALAPTAGVLLVGATHYPDADVLPNSLKALFPVRMALRCADMYHSEAVLGAGARGRGARAEELPADMPGAAVMVGAGDGPISFRFHQVDRADLERAAALAVQLRAEAGTLPRRGDRVASAPPLLAEALAAFAGADALRTQDLLAALQVADPGRAGWDATRLSAELRPYGIRPVQLGRAHAGEGESNPRGYRRAAVEAALQTLLQPR